MKSYSIALIPGDGIGRDVIAAAWTVLETAAKNFGFALACTEFPWSCRFFKETGRMSVDLRWKHIRVGMYFIIGRQAAAHLTEIALSKAESSVSAVRFGTL